MAASLLPDYLTFLRVLGWATATIVCWLAAGAPGMPPRRAGLALSLFCAAQLSFGIGGFFHYDALSFGSAMGGWLALAKLASFGFLREFARMLGGGRAGPTASRFGLAALTVAIGLAAAGMVFPGRVGWGAGLGELGLLILPPLICADAIWRLVQWTPAGREPVRDRFAPMRWTAAVAAIVYVGICVALATRPETPALVAALQPLVPWLLAGCFAWANLRAAGARRRPTAGFALALVGFAAVTPLAMRAAGPAEAHTMLLVGGLAVVFCEAGFVFAWWQALAVAHQLAQARREAASRAKTEFLAFLGHELRTPLQAILGRAELLGSGQDDPVARGAAVATIAAEGRVMLSLVNDLLDLGAIEAGRFELRLQAFSLRELLASTAATHGASARAKQLEFELVVASEVPDGILGDELRWRQILGNLLGNAVKYTMGGRVELCVTREPARAVDAPGAARVRMVVRDTGIGLPPEKIAGLFTLFTRLETSGATAREGAGVGLALVKRLVDLMDGTVSAANRDDGLGAEFAVELTVPTVAAEALPLPVARAMSAGSGSSQRVLVVEDHPAARDVLMDFLRSLGHAPVAAVDGIAMEVALAVGKFDAVVLDLNLPGANALQLASDLSRQRGPLARPRIIGCSADARSETRAAALAAGMDLFIPKPVSCAELASALGEKPVAGLDLFAVMRADDVAGAVRRLTSIELPAECGAIRRAADAGEWPEVRRRAHYLRNSALVLGGPALMLAARNVEDAAQRTDGPAVHVALQLLAGIVAAGAESLHTLEDALDDGL